MLTLKAFWYNDERKNVCGLRIRELRQKKELTIQKLSVMAQLAGYEFITPNGISKAELGIRFIRGFHICGTIGYDSGIFIRIRGEK